MGEKRGREMNIGKKVLITAVIFLAILELYLIAQMFIYLVDIGVLK
jgi:hypothetical protein